MRTRPPTRPRTPFFLPPAVLVLIAALLALLGAPRGGGEIGMPRSFVESVAADEVPPHGQVGGLLGLGHRLLVPVLGDVGDPGRTARQAAQHRERALDRGIVFQRGDHQHRARRVELANLRQQQASALAYFDVFWILAVVMVALVFVVLLMKRSVAEKGARIGSEPKRRCDTVCEPDFFES